MSGQEDTRLVDHLYGELSEKEARDFRRALEEDPALREEVESFEKTLGALRAIEDDDPPPQLDALILAHARQEADTLAQNQNSFFARLRRFISSPVGAIAVTASVAAVAAVVTIPTMMLQRSADQAAPARAQSASEGYVAQPSPVVVPDGLAKKELQLEEKPAEQARPATERTVAIAGPDSDGNAREAEEQSETRALREPRKRRAAPPKNDAAKIAKPQDQPPAAAEPMKRGDQFGEDTEADDSGQDSVTGGVALGERGAGGGFAGKEGGRVATTAPREESKPSRDARAELDEPKTVAKDKASKSPMSAKDATSLANDFIVAAETQLAAHDAEGARRILLRGLAVTVGTPARAAVALRLAQLDFAEKRFSEAAQHAKIAADTKGFARWNEAIELMRRAEVEIRLADDSVRSSDVNSAKAARKKAAPATKSEMPAPSDEAQHQRESLETVK